VGDSGPGTAGQDSGDDTSPDSGVDTASAEGWTWTGSGADGPLVVTGTLDLATDTSGSRSVADGISYRVEALATDRVTTREPVTGIAEGDEVLVLNLQGGKDLHGSAGRYEFARVAAVSGAVLTLASDLNTVFGELGNSDLAEQVVIVQRVPQYTDVQVSAGSTLTTSGWDGERGGVLAFRATGTVLVEAGGVVTVDERGYAAGDTGSCSECDAYQGESFMGPGVGNESGPPYNEGIAGYLPNGGGGGANITGGGGNYGGGATAAEAWNPEDYSAPQAGEVYGVADLATLFPGSGGGGVWSGATLHEDEDPGPGGAGAGILFVAAAHLVVETTGGISARGGSTEHWSEGSWTYGAGGGSGGTVWLIAGELDLAEDGIQATGGAGMSDCKREGGNGGYGRVRVDCSTCNGQAAGTDGSAAALAAGSEPDPGWSEVPD